MVLLVSGDLTLLLAWLPVSGDRGLEVEGGDRGLEVEGGDRGRSGDLERVRGGMLEGSEGREAWWDGGLSGEHNPDSRD